MRGQFGRWLWGLIPLTLPFLGAWYLNWDSLEQDLQTRAAEALKSAGDDWARVAVYGRDVTLSGAAPSEAAVDSALEVVAGVYGIRTIKQDATIAPPQPPPPPPPPPQAPQPLTAPAISSALASGGVPEIKGTWPEGIAKTLVVTLAGKSYRLGIDPQLSSDGLGNWTLRLTGPIADGIYNVKVEISDGATSVAVDNSKDELIVDTAPPARPTIEVSPGSMGPAVEGTWAEGDAKSLKVIFAGKTYVLGKDSALISQGNGRWSFKLPSGIADGTYDIEVETADIAGNISRNNASITIKTPEPLAPPTVRGLSASSARPRIEGTWDEAHARSLRVTLADRTYTLGRDPGLTTDGKGNWTLTPYAELRNGIYDVKVEETDGSGRSASDVSANDLTISVPTPTPPLARPTVRSATVTVARPKISGTWDEAHAKSLKVTLAGKTFTFGHDPALVTDGKGNWTLTPESDLPNGFYDIKVETTDTTGQVVTDVSPSDLRIAVPTPSPAPPTAPSMAPPTTSKRSERAIRPKMQGLWDEAHAKSLSVSVGGRIYILGRDPALVSDGNGRWTLTPQSELKSGIYDVVVETTDAVGKTLRDQTVGELTVEVPPQEPAAALAPAAPAIHPPSVDKASQEVTRPRITGAWDEGNAKILTVSVGGKTYRLGRNSTLSSDGKAHWSLTPDSDLKNGTYDVVVETADAAGRVLRDETVAELTIAVPRHVAPPTVNGSAVSVARPILTGSWSEGTAKRLEVSIAGDTYELGRDDALLSDGKGNWKLILPRPLRDGRYDVVVESDDQRGEKQRASAEVVVDAVGPASPTVGLYSGTGSPQAIKGSWPEGDAITLTITLAGETYVLGQDSVLQSDGKGQWSLKLDSPLGSGSYDIGATVRDAKNRAASDQTKFEILIKEQSAQVELLSKAAEQPKARQKRQQQSEVAPSSGQTLPVQPPQPGQPASRCENRTAKTISGQMVFFLSDRAEISWESQVLINTMAAAMKTCPAVKIEIAGHTDSTGSSMLNTALSERRAAAVADALAAQGVARANLSTVGYGATKPLADNRTPEGRAVNRRIEISAEP